MPTKINDRESFLIPLGKHLAILRKEQGLTQAELAHSINISQQVYASYETGVKRITVSRLPKLAACLDVSVDELLGLPMQKKRGPQSKLEKQIREIEKLPSQKKKFISEFLATTLAS